ncbi:MAG: hypothetical protein K2X39_05960, partial [Silvanigrellaceae bacterium]|nr:hypothetical protein [Silvanigrellaceae bacterium]
MNFSQNINAIFFIMCLISLSLSKQGYCNPPLPVFPSHSSLSPLSRGELNRMAEETQKKLENSLLLGLVEALHDFYSSANLSYELEDVMERCLLKFYHEIRALSFALVSVPHVHLASEIEQRVESFMRHFNREGYNFGMVFTLWRNDPSLPEKKSKRIKTSHEDLEKGTASDQSSSSCALSSGISIGFTKSMATTTST